MKYNDSRWSSRPWKKAFSTVHYKRGLTILLAVAVLLVISYTLILPASTLTADKANEQGGIDVPQEELQIAEEGDAADDESEHKALSKKEKKEKKETVDSLAYEGEGYVVRIENADLAADTSLNVKEIREDSDKSKERKAYKRYYKDALEAVQKEKGGKNIAGLSVAKFYDITLDADGQEVQPDQAVDVTIAYDKALALEDEQNLRVIHFRENPETGEVTPEVLDRKDVSLALNKNGKLKKAGFQAESFSVYAVVSTMDLQTEVISASGDTYKVTVKYEEDAEIPEGAELKVREISPKDKEYKAVQKKAGKELTEKMKKAIPAHPVLFDIAIYDGETEIEPAEGSKVQVEVKLVKDSVTGTYSDKDSPILINNKPVKDDELQKGQKLQVIHDTEAGDLDVMEVKEKNDDKHVVGQFTTDSFSNWLLFLDEDLASINVETRDSLTLRPYTEWVWKKDAETDEYKNIEWSFPSSEWDSWGNWENGVYYTFYQHKTNGTRFRSFSKTDDQLNETYTVVTSEWLNAGSFDLRTTKGKVIHVNVSQGDGNHKPGTVAGIPDLKVNLFDYDVPGSGNNYDFTKSGSLDEENNRANSAYNQSVNQNHQLHFLGWGADSNPTDWINGYTKDVPKQEIVESELKKANESDTEKYPVLNYGDHENLKYLFDTNSKNHNIYAFPNAGGLFQQDNHGFYYYNSNVNYAEYNRGSNSFTLYEHTYSQHTSGSNGANAKPIGFYPFHEYDTGNVNPGTTGMNFNKNLNHHFGMSMSVDFEMPKDRQAEFNGNKEDIIYEFSGDDDLWVFIDDELVLDIGGIHQPVTGKINFTTGEITVYGKGTTTKTFDVGAHTMKMYYIERGGCDSNLSVKFNLPLVKGKASINVAKKSLANDTTDPNKPLAGAIFGIWENADCTGEPYMTGTSDDEGHIDFGSLPVKNAGQKFYIREMVPPTGYLLNRTIYTATASEQDANGNYTLTVTEGNTPVETVGQKPVYSIIRDDRANPINLSVEKKWQNADGTEMETAPNKTAQFELKRKYNYVEVDQGPANSTIEVYVVDQNWSNATLKETKEFAGGSTADVNWGYGNSYGWPKGGYRVDGGSNQNKAEGSAAAIPLTAGATTKVYIFDGNKGTQYANEGVRNITVTGTAPSTGTGTITTGEGDDTEYQGPVITLPTSSGVWSDTFSNLPVKEEKNGRIYFYSYYIVEKENPSGFETVYYDSQGRQINDPSSLQTNVSGTQTIANRKLMDVPVIKTWDDFSGNEFTWTADFQLEQRELKVNASDPDAADAISDWKPIDGKTIRISKGQTGQDICFTGLPMYRLHSNGTLYRIVYSVEETAYEVKEGDTVVSKWDDEHGHTIGHRYTPQFIQDAGGNEKGEKPYEIKLANTLHNPTVTNTIDLSLEKKWTAGGSPYNTSNGASATFVLKRYVHEEYRNYSHVEDMTDKVTITLDVAGTGANPTITVPRGAMVSISGKVLAGKNAVIEFKRADEAMLSKVIDNTSSRSLKSFDITFEATQDETVTLYRGDNYVSGGREGFRLTDYGDQNTAKVDKHFSQEFTLSDVENWRKQFSDLPQIEEDEMDEVSHVQTITVFDYYFEEIACNPEGFHPVFKTTNDHLLGDVNNPVDISQDLVAENQAEEGSLKLKKLVRVNEFDPLGENVSAADKTKADGTYTFTIVGKEGTRTAGLSHTVTITVLNGEVSSATIDGKTATLGSDGTVLLSGLVTGQYIVTEEEDANTVCTCVNDSQAATTDRTAEITVVKDGPDVEPQQVQYTNNYASSGEDIAHVSVRKTFIGLKASEIPANFQVNATVKATIDGVEKTFTYTLKGPTNQQQDGVTLTTTTQDGNPVWNWRIAIAGLRPDAMLTIEETGYPVAGYEVSTTTNGVENKTKYEGTVSAATVIQDFTPDVITANNWVTFPVNDTGNTAKIFMARLTSDKTTLVISKNRLTLSEKAKIEEQLKHMPNANDWTHGGNAVLYYNFEEAGSDQIIVKGRTVTYSDTNGGQITFNKKCQWSMVATGNITYVPGRPADVNFVNRYTEIPLEIDIIKVDKENSDTKLPGAVFTLRKLSGPTDHPENPPEPLPSGEFAGSVVGDSDPTATNTGKTSFSNLTSGYYEITEKVAPQGYVQTADTKIYFKIEGGVVSRIEWSASQSKWVEKHDDEIVSFVPAQGASGNNPATNAAFTVGNERGAALPNTGGSGTTLIYLLGSMLIGLAGVGLVMRRRRTET